MSKKINAFLIGPVAITLFLLFAALSALTGVGGLMMLQGRNRGLALAGSIASSVNISCCCILGIPFGIWSLVVLGRPEVRDAFR